MYESYVGGIDIPDTLHLVFYLPVSFPTSHKCLLTEGQIQKEDLYLSVNVYILFPECL